MSIFIRALRKYFGAIIRNIFTILRMHRVALLFINDVVAILQLKKNTSIIMKRMIAQYLIEMQGLESNKGKVICQIIYQV